jgi:hypothetical protein
MIAPRGGMDGRCSWTSIGISKAIVADAIMSTSIQITMRRALRLITQ